MKKEKEKKAELIEEENIPENENNPDEEILEKIDPADEAKAPEKANIDLKEDIELFHSLYPELKADDIPAEVWDEVEKGIPLAASFALYEKKEQKKKEEMEKQNKINAETAPPKLTGNHGDEGYFSPEAVKAMSDEQVRKNYNQILKSMEKWN